MTTLLDQLVKESIKQQPPVSPISERENVGSDQTSEQGETSNQDGRVAGASPQPVDLPPATSPTGFTDSPEIFNPEIHAVNDDGSPRLKKDGTYSKKRGRRMGGTNAPTATHGSIPNTDQERLQKSYAAAVATVQTVFILGNVLGGAEFTPIVDVEKGVNEPKMLTDAWTQYYMTTDVDGIPPWFGVLIATGSYFALRLSMPKTQSRLGVAWDWCRSWFVDVPPPRKSVVNTTPESEKKDAISG